MSQSSDGDKQFPDSRPGLLVGRSSWSIELRKVSKLIVSVAAFGVLCVISAPVAVRIAMQPYIYQNIDTGAIPSEPVAIVLGASVRRGDPSPILAARADGAIDLFRKIKVQRILITGDSRRRSHDEVAATREYLAEAGVPSADIATDPFGYDTYASMYRASHIFHIYRAAVVTQDFHLPRAIMIARAQGIDAVGFTASGGTLYDYAREVPATMKALWDIAEHRVQ